MGKITAWYFTGVFVGVCITSAFFTSAIYSPLVLPLIVLMAASFIFSLDTFKN